MTESAEQDPGVNSGADHDTRTAFQRRRWPRSRWSRWVLGVLLTLWAVPIVGGCLLVLLPTTGLTGAAISAMMTSLSLFMVIPAAIGIGFMIVVWRMRWRRTTGVVAVVTALALAAAVVPWADASRTAAANEVDLSLPAYFDSGPRPAGPDSTEVYNTVNGEHLRLDVWRPPRPARGNPAIVWVHGGAWIMGHRSQSPARNQWFVDHGYTVFDIDYRLSPPPRWDAQTGDVKCALGWVREHAARYGVNPGALSVGGDSAGGTLALLAAYTTGTGRFAPSCAKPEVGVKSVISFYSPTDTVALHRDSGTPSLVKRTATDHFGGTPGTAPEAYRSTSPNTYARPGLPPTLLIQGRTDHVVPKSQATSLATELRTDGVPHRLLLLPWADHAFDAARGAWATQIANGTTKQFLNTYALPRQS